ncbi:hypothetical protein Tco_1314518 [Tanacetum coccineum]
MSWFSRCSWYGGPFNSGNCRQCTNVSFRDEFVRNPDPISNNETPDYPYPPSQPQTSSFDQFHCFGCGDPLEDGVRCQRCTCKWSGYGLREGFNIESKDSYVSNLDEPALLVTPLSNANEDECFDPGGDFDEIDAFLDVDISIDIENGYHDSEGDIIYLESLLIDDTIPNLPPKVFLDHDPKNFRPRDLGEILFSNICEITL